VKLIALSSEAIKFEGSCASVLPYALMACTGSILLVTLTGYISLDEKTTNRLGAWPILMYYPVIFLNGLGRAVKICIDIQRRHVAVLLISFLM